MSDISTRVKAIIVDKLGVDEKEVTPEASFTNDLGADSLDTVESRIIGIEPMISITAKSTIVTESMFLKSNSICHLLFLRYVQ